MAHISLSPDEAKTLCLLNVAQLQDYLSRIPAMVEGGSSGLTKEHVSFIETHIKRGNVFLAAWVQAKMPGTEQKAEPKPEVTNGAVPKKRGGWPKGKPRKRMNPNPVVAQ